MAAEAEDLCVLEAVFIQERKQGLGLLEHLVILLAAIQEEAMF
jgi:hypothetical protein